jgi:hypothetical protein
LELVRVLLKHQQIVFVVVENQRKNHHQNEQEERWVLLFVVLQVELKHIDELIMKNVDVVNEIVEMYYHHYHSLHQELIEEDQVQDRE